MKDIKEVAALIKTAIEEQIDDNNPEQIKEKIMELSALQGSAASLQANAKKILLRKEMELIKLYKNEDLQASVLMRKITAECYEEQGWLVYTERLSAGISHSIDGLRSVLSYLKSEMENLKNQTA